MKDNSSSSTTPSKQTVKPPKPRKGFPLWAHAGSGQWAKKINKKLCYFGSWRQDSTGEAALALYERELPYVKRGETPPRGYVSSDGCTLRELCNDFLTSVVSLVCSGGCDSESSAPPTNRPPPSPGKR